MTELEKILIQQIAATGPIKLSDFMEACLLHPEHGYYTVQTVFGKAGDFVTAPEISPMFGELIGLSLADAWIRQGKPKDAIIAEIGPGRGVLMRDMRRAIKVAGDFANAPIHMVEAAEKLRKLQKDLHPDVTHHETVATLPQRPLFLIANEFLDALPIRQFKRTEKAWVECLVGVADGKLTYGLSGEGHYDFLTHRVEDTKSGDVVEHCPALPAVVAALSDHISQYGGAALFIDYGDWRSQGNTLQALDNHKHVMTLDAPGNNDMTAHVDFEAVFNAATSATVSRLVTQGVFLERLGITERAKKIAEHLDGDRLENHITAHKRLIHPDEMGTLFKVMGIGPSPETLPAGLTT